MISEPEKLVLEETKLSINRCNDEELFAWYKFLVVDCNSTIKAEILVLLRQELKRREAVR